MGTDAGAFAAARAFAAGAGIGLFFLNDFIIYRQLSSTLLSVSVVLDAESEDSAGKKRLLETVFFDPPLTSVYGGGGGGQRNACAP